MTELKDGLIILFSFLIIALIFVHISQSKKLNYLHETGSSILLGILFSFLIDLFSDGNRDKFPHTFLQFKTDAFLNFFLPAIIFESGYNVDLKPFFKNTATIMLFAFFGTLISCFGVSFLMILLVKLDLLSGLNLSVKDCLIFGALISATDPVSTLAIFKSLNVNDDLFANVFGESILNDAVAMVLVKTFLKFGSDPITFVFVLKIVLQFCGIFLGSFAMGIAFGAVVSLLLKYFNFQKLPMVECSLLLMISWLSFIVSEKMGLSGIVATLYCGLFNSHYSYQNLSSESKRYSRKAISFISFVSETFVFLSLGLSTFSFNHSVNFPMIIWPNLACIFVRSFAIYPLSFLKNFFSVNSKKLNYKSQFVIFFSGLRGAMAFCLSLFLQTKNGNVMMTTTLSIIFFTVFVVGGLTKPILIKLKLQGTKLKASTSVKDSNIINNNADNLTVDFNEKRNDENKLRSNSNSDSDDGREIISGSESGSASRSGIENNNKSRWFTFEKKYISPFLIKKNFMNETQTQNNINTIFENNENSNILLNQIDSIDYNADLEMKKKKLINSNINNNNSESENFN
ncbi:sodium/hydrogen exchanger [Anaeramoeba flamelloides]|uniref:Sodium/hydrogen exchanger n=1 Tax=Anaeramoeba flamelloides TaxID=1746091 RepID=A0ABQ8YLW7_9EUKA|nr:sodium/hydrogen exchanger [Anaeramoeba flamelloides]